MQYFEEAVIKKFLPLFKQHKVELVIGIISILAMTASILVLLSLNKQTDAEGAEITFNQEADSKEEKGEGTEKNILVDLSGAVEKPDTYELKEGSRLKDLLKQANGLSSSADRQFFERNFNLAKVLIDQEKIHIPNKEEVEDGLFKEAVFVVNSSVGSGVALGVSTGGSNQGVVNINSASEGELDKLPGIGPVTANKIIDGRPFSSALDLLNNKIVNKSQWEKIKEMITVQ